MAQQPPSAPPQAPAHAPSSQSSNSPPPPRELTPAEINALQTMMTDRAAGSVLTPGNAQALRNRVLDEQAAAGLSAESFKPRPRSLYIDPQILLQTPQSIQLALGVVTPITFLDERGHPWPVASVAFDPRMFAQDGAGCGAQSQGGAISGGGGERPSTIHLMPCRISTWGDVSIQLEGYPLPVVLMMRSGGSHGEVDLPVTVRVKGRSPTAPVQPIEAAAAYTPAPARLAASAVAVKSMETEHGRIKPDRYLDVFGAGVPPHNARRVEIDDPVVSGWIFNGHFYLRGPVTVVNPAQDAMAESVGGMKVWRFDRPVPRVLVIDETGAERSLTVNF